MKYIELIETLQRVGLTRTALRPAFVEALESFTHEDWYALAGYTFSTNNASNITFLFLAAQYGWTDLASKLIEQGAAVGYEIVFNGTTKCRAIDIAIKQKDLPMIKVLAQAGIHQGSWNTEDASIIDAAVESSPEIFEYLAEKINIYKKSIDRGMPTWVVLLANNRHDIFCHLLKKGLIQDDPAKQNGCNYLLFMMGFVKTLKRFNENDFINILPALIDAGVNINFVDNDHRNVLFWALHFRWFTLAKMIVESGKMNLAEHTLANTAVYELLKSEKDYPMMQHLLGKGLLSQAI